MLFDGLFPIVRRNRRLRGEVLAEEVAKWKNRPVLEVLSLLVHDRHSYEIVKDELSHRVLLTLLDMRDDIVLINVSVSNGGLSDFAPPCRIIEYHADGTADTY